MITKKIGNRGLLFTFEEIEVPLSNNASIYLISTYDKYYLCDTYIGPLAMEYVKPYVDKNKEIIIFNSHSDWEHTWGNYVFKDAIIIGHDSGMKRIKEKAKYDLDRFARYNKESKEPVNLMFSNGIKFEKDGIEFIYAPGHSLDSSICYDLKESIIYTGDLVEFSQPIIKHNDLQAYINTLEYLKSLPAEIIISAHSGIINKELIDEKINYIKNLLEREISKDYSFSQA